MAAGQPAAMKPRDKAHALWASNFAGRNASEARAGLESKDVDADPPMRRGRLYGQGSNQHVHLIQSTGVLSAACREGGLGNWGRPGTGGGRASNIGRKGDGPSGSRRGSDVPKKPGNAGGGKDP